jgi:hypothetical protein
MIWLMVMQVVSILVELVRLGRQSESERDLEILLLRRQRAIYERKRDRAPHLSRGEKLMLVVLATKLKTRTGRTIKAMGEVIRIVKPATLFQWHKQLVRLKWTYRQRNPGGRPRTDREIERVVVRLARENGWGFERIEGELLKLGYTISHETVGNILQRLTTARIDMEMHSRCDTTPLQHPADGHQIAVRRVHRTADDDLINLYSRDFPNRHNVVRGRRAGDKRLKRRKIDFVVLVVNRPFISRQLLPALSPPL